ncbi:MAG: efflux RND transporter permease subunit [Spirochaetaceae bacterium]|nr:MAG: efflux RND transporter permease subunit [Spirochaetaceae bacterium]
MKITDLSVKRPVTATVFYLALIVLGVFSLGRLAIDLIPDISFPVIVIYSTYPGVSPEEVEENLTKVIENTASSASRIEKVSSTSREGTSVVVVEYQWGTDLAEASNDLRERLDLIRDFIPEDASQPVLFKFDPSMTPIMVLSLEGRRDLESLRFIAENTIQTSLEQIDGVASVSVEGGLQKQIHIDLDRTLLASYGLSIDRIVNAVRGENLNVTGGAVTEGARKYSLRTIGRLDDLVEIRSIIVGNKNGKPVYLENVAAVYSGYVDDEMDVKVDRNEAIILHVQKQSGTNTVLISNRVQERIDTIKRSLPEDVRLVELFVSAEFINNAITNVWRVALLGGALAIFILLIFLRNLPTTLIVAVSIPLSIIITIIAMYFFNLTLNMLSLGGLALGIGMLVDNSIVIIENIFRYRESGAKAGEAARHGSQEMANAIIASTLTTVAVFLPLVLFIRGLARELFRDLAFTVTFSLLASLLVALTVIPMLSSRIRKVAIKKKSNTLLDVEEELKGRGSALRLLDRIYGASLSWALRHKALVLIVIVLLFAGSLAMIPRVGVELFPESDQGMIMMDIETAVGSDIDTTREAVEKIYGLVEENVPERKVSVVLSGVSGGFFSTTASNRGSIQIALEELEDRDRSDREIIDSLRPLVAQVPGAEVRFSSGFGPGGGGGMSGGLTVSIRGNDLEKGKGLALRIEDIMNSVEAIQDAQVSREEGLPEYRIRVDRNRVAQYGLTTAQVGTTIKRAFAGETVATVLYEGDEVDVRVRFRPEDRVSVGDIDQISVSSPLGFSVPLANLVEVEKAYGPVSIARENQQRVIDINARVTGDVRTAVNTLKEQVDQLAIPAGFSVVYGGSWEDIQAVIKDLVLVLILSVALIYFIMAAQFESFRDPFIIMFTLPMTFVGVIWIHLLTGTIFSAFSGIGLLMLVGIVVNNGIILVDYTNLLRKRDYDLTRAVVAAGRIRLRPILMTMLTTVLALMPMAFFGGSGSELRKPMALTVTGGLLVSTVFTLILIPVLYHLFEGSREKRRLRRLAEGGDQTQLVAIAQTAEQPAEREAIRG